MIHSLGKTGRIFRRSLHPTKFMWRCHVFFLNMLYRKVAGFWYYGTGQQTIQRYHHLGSYQILLQSHFLGVLGSFNYSTVKLSQVDSKPATPNQQSNNWLVSIPCGTSEPLTGLVQIYHQYKSIPLVCVGSGWTLFCSEEPFEKYAFFSQLGQDVQELLGDFDSMLVMFDGFLWYMMMYYDVCCMYTCS